MSVNGGAVSKLYLKHYEDGSVQVRVTPISNGYLVKPGGGQQPVYYPSYQEAAADVTRALIEAFKPEPAIRPAPKSDQVSS